MFPIGAVLDGETYSYFLRYNLVLANLISPDCINAVDNLFSHHLEGKIALNASRAPIHVWGYANGRATTGGCPYGAAPRGRDLLAPGER